MDKKYTLIKEINNDDCRFIVNVLDSYLKNTSDFEQKQENTSIITDETHLASLKNVIDLDTIWSKPYFYTKMRLKLTEIVNRFNNESYEKIKKHPIRFCKKISKIKITANFVKPEGCIDIVDFINDLKTKEDLDYTFFAKNIDEETLFKEEQIKKAIEAIKIKNRKEQISYIYDEVCAYLNSDFIQNNYCDFENNKCIAQRHFNFYPINRKNGCCFMEVRTCTHLNSNGTCKVECIACKLFACPYLSKKGIGYYANQFVLFKAFFTKEQRKHLVFDFYKPKAYVIGKILEQENK